MQFRTAQYRYPGPFRLDITVKGQDEVGRVFAPTWGMVTDYKKTGDKDRYVDLYHEMILASLENHKDVWEQVLTREYIVLVCFCKAGDFCHRTLLAHYLVHFGAKYHGELMPDDFEHIKHLWERT